MIRRTLACAAVLVCVLAGFVTLSAQSPFPSPDVPPLYVSIDEEPALPAIEDVAFLLARLQVPQESQDEFVPLEELTLDDLPPEERLPAAPLLVGAYAFVLVALFTYVTLVARRLTGLQRDIARLEKTIGSDGKG